MADIEFDLIGDRAIDRRVLKIADRLGDLRPFWNRFADALANYNKRVFNSEGKFGGAGWAPLSPDYGAWKAVNYPGKTILRRTDTLYDSLTKRPFGIENLTGSVARFGTDVPYAGYHQTGTRFMPARPFMPDKPVMRTVMAVEARRLLRQHVMKSTR